MSSDLLPEVTIARVLARERRQLIVNELNRTGTLKTSELVTQFGVSDVTIRTDLDVLERDGRLTRTHGGAVPADLSQATVGFEVRMALQSDAKRRIALAAATYIHSDQTVILDAGTTINHLAQVLPEVTNLTVYTPGLTQAQQLVGLRGIDVHLLGGQLDNTWLQTIGTPRQQGIKRLLVETVFLGAWGIDSDLDVVDSSNAICRMKLQYIRRARKVILLMDSTKLGRTGSVKIMPLGDAHVLITDRGISDEQRQQLEQLDLEVVIA